MVVETPAGTGVSLFWPPNKTLASRKYFFIAAEAPAGVRPSQNPPRATRAVVGIGGWRPSEAARPRAASWSWPGRRSSKLVSASPRQQPPQILRGHDDERP